MIWGCVWMLPCSDSKVNKKCEIAKAGKDASIYGFFLDWLSMQTLWINQCPSIFAVLHELVGFDVWQVLFFCVKFQSKLGGEAQSTRGAQLTSLSCVHYRWRWWTKSSQAVDMMYLCRIFIGFNTSQVGVSRLDGFLLSTVRLEIQWCWGWLRLHTTVLLLALGRYHDFLTPGVCP